MADQEPTVSRYVALRNAFFSGVILVAPISLTIWFFSYIIDFVGGRFKGLFLYFIPESLRDRQGLDTIWSIVATLIVVALVTLLGYVSRYVFGDRGAYAFIGNCNHCGTPSHRYFKCPLDYFQCFGVPCPGFDHLGNRLAGPAWDSATRLSDSASAAWPAYIATHGLVAHGKFCIEGAFDTGAAPVAAQSVP